MQKTLDDVLAEAALRDLQMRYCRAVDRMDWPLFRSCFHADANLEYAFYTGPLEPFIEASIDGLANYRWTTHNTGNQLVEVSGNTAWAEHYTVATHRIAPDEHGPERDLVAAVRYIDRAECRDGDWRIAGRLQVLDWWRIDAVSDIGPPLREPNARRDREDLSYSWS